MCARLNVRDQQTPDALVLRFELHKSNRLLWCLQYTSEFSITPSQLTGFISKCYDHISDLSDGVCHVSCSKNPSAQAVVYTGGDKFILAVSYVEGRKHLPVIDLRRAA